MAYHVYYPFGEEATAFNQDTERMKFTGHERDLASLAGAGDDLDYMHARFYAPLVGRFISPDRQDISDLFHAQSWNRYAYTLGNPIRYIDPDGRKERDGSLAGLVVNHSSEVIWVAGDVDGKMVVIPLLPGESSANYFQDADAIVIDPGIATAEGAQFGPSIEGENSGAFKIGVSAVGVEDSGPLNLGLNRSTGYGISWVLGRSGFLDAEEARQEGWVVPGDRQAAEKKKEELRKRMEEKEKKRKEERGKEEKEATHI